MIIIGIDPGLAIVGYGVIKFDRSRFTTLDYGVLLTPAGMKVEKRLELIYDGLNTLIKKYNPVEMAVEELFFNTNIKTAIMVAEARGVVLLCGEKNNIKISEYTPLQVKQAVVGYGRAEKMQVITMTKDILRLKETPKPDDAADALAIAVCHAHSASSRLSEYYNK